MNRKKVQVATDSYWDLLITFGFESQYSLSPERLTAVVHNNLVGYHQRHTLKITKAGMIGRYKCSFGCSDSDNIQEKIAEILVVLSAQEEKVSMALEMEAAKGLLDIHD